MTNYNDINTYRMEHDPVSIMRDTLDCLAAEHSNNDIDACLMRDEWIEKGYQMLHRLHLRAEEARDAAKRFGA